MINIISITSIVSNTKEKSSTNWHFTCQSTRIYENFKEQYFRSMQNTSWLFEKFRAMILLKKMILNRKWMIWLGCTSKCKKNWKQHHIEHEPKFLPWLTLVPDKWSQAYCSEYFNVFEYLIGTSHEIKTVGGILAKPTPIKRINFQHWNTSSGNRRLWR